MRKQLLTLAVSSGLILVSSVARAGWEEGVQALKAKDYSTAAKEFQQVVDQQPEWAPGQRMLGQVLIKLNRTDEALTHLRKAYDLAPGDAPTQFALGQAYVQAKRYADGASILSKVDSGKLPAGQKSTLDQLLAVALSKSGQSDAATAALRRAAAASPNDADVQYQYGVAALNAGDLSAAIGALEKSVSVAAGTENRRALVQALMQQGRRSQGATKTQSYGRAAQVAGQLARSESNFDNHLMEAGAALGAKQYDTALAAAERASRANSSDWLPYYYKGQAHTQKRQFSSAESELRKALNNASSSADKATVWSQLGFVFEKTRSYDEAIAAYTQAGNSAAAERVRVNKDTAAYNTSVEAENRELEALRAEQEALENQLKNLPGAAEPPNLR